MSNPDNCLIICNGPSLNDIPNELLNKYQAFGSNRVYLRYIPNYYACVDPNCVQFIEEIEALKGTTKYIGERLSDSITDSIPLHSVSAKIFSKDPLMKVYEGWTTTYVLMQLAYYLGFQKVGLVGCDHYYGEFDEQGNLIGEDNTHFSKDYLDGVEWGKPNLEKTEEAYRIAKKIFEEDGREIVNLSTETKLEVFRKEDWQSWM